MSSALREGFESMGQPVPEERKKIAEQHMKQMDDAGSLDQVDRWRISGQMATAIEKDDPHQAIEIAEEHFDYYGARRLLACIVVAPIEEDT